MLEIPAQVAERHLRLGRVIMVELVVLQQVKAVAVAELAQLDRMRLLQLPAAMAARGRRLAYQVLL